MMYGYFQVTGAHGAVHDYSDLFRITSHGDDVQDFDTRRDQVLLPIKEVPSGNILESCVRCACIRESDQLKNRIGNIRTRN